MLSYRSALTAAAAAGLAAALSGCGAFFPLPKAAPPRPSASAGAEYASVTQYMAAHPMPKPPAGMRGGILVSSASKGYVCLGWCHTWRGLVVMPDGFTEVLHSDQGSNGMQDYVTPGDYFWFPASGPVDAPGDNTGARPAKVIVRGATTP